MAQTSIFSHITFPTWGHFTHLLIFTPILYSWIHFPVGKHLFFRMICGWGRSYPFTFYGVLGRKLVSFAHMIGCQQHTFQVRTLAKPVALQSWACTHRSYQTMFGLHGVCFSQLGPAGGHFEGLWQRSSSSFSHKGANCPHVVALLWSSHLERIWTPGPTWWGCNCCLTVLTRPLTGWKHGLFFSFLAIFVTVSQMLRRPFLALTFYLHLSSPSPLEKLSQRCYFLYTLDITMQP